MRKGGPGKKRRLGEEHVRLYTCTCTYVVIILCLYLKHFVWGRFNTRNHACRIKGTLLYLCKVILRVAIENHLANLNEWILRMWPDLGCKNIHIATNESILFGKGKYCAIVFKFCK